MLGEKQSIILIVKKHVLRVEDWKK